MTPRPASFALIAIVAVGHLINDLLQALLPAIYPIIKVELALDFWQIGMLTLAGQATASVLQPLIGHLLDERPHPYALAFGMGVLLAAVLLLGVATEFSGLLAGSTLMGVASAIFHPEASRITRLASGGRHGLAQSLLQTGGNLGSALGPLAAALVVARGQRMRIAWFGLLALAGLVMTWRVGQWYRDTGAIDRTASAEPRPPIAHLSTRQIRAAFVVLGVLLFSKFIYTASLTNYFTFFLIERHGVAVATAQVHLFVFLAAVAAGTLVGGLVGDRVGPKPVIWVSVFGVLPFAVALPYASLFWTGVLSVVVGLIIASAFSAVLVYALELLPGRVGLVAGLFFGLAFGIGGIGAAALGKLADGYGLTTVFTLAAWMPALGLLTWFLPNTRAGSPRIR